MRPEYRRMARDLSRLVAPFGCDLSDQTAADLDVLMVAVECVDRILDAIDDPARRRALTDVVVAALGSGAVCAAPDRELAAALDPLAAVVDRRGVARAAAAIAAEIFAVTERMRGARGATEYIAASCREGALLVELTVLLAPELNPAARSFLARLAEPANLLDKLIDARADHRAGEIAVRPGARFHARLLLALAGRILPVIAAYPRPPALAGWALPYLAMMWRSGRAV